MASKNSIKNLQKLVNEICETYGEPETPEDVRRLWEIAERKYSDRAIEIVKTAISYRQIHNMDKWFKQALATVRG